MSILCGTDIIEIDRIRKSLDRAGHAFRDKVFTEHEIAYCEDKGAAKFQSYAARFAAKEAVSKAFGTGMGKDLGWKDIEVVNDERGKPGIVLKGNARKVFEELQACSISLSLSHCENYAVAYAVIEVR